MSDDVCKCGKPAADSEHSCPYKKEVKDDSATLCRCCNDCVYECGQDI